MELLPNSKEELRQILKDLPKNCGVYKFIGKNKIPIYIGKAKNIRNRVTSYFRDSTNQTQKILLIDLYF